MNIQVHLPAGYVSRNVTLKVCRRYPRRRWDILAVDGMGTSFRVTVPRIPTDDFTTARHAAAVLATLPQGRFWAASDRPRVDIAA